MWTFPALPGQIVLARRRVSAYAEAHGATVAALADIQLAVSEAMTNVVLHAYRHVDGSGEAHVAVEAQDGCIRIVVSDDGLGMTTRPDSPGLGLGLPVLKQICDRVEVGHRASGGTDLILTLVLDP